MSRHGRVTRRRVVQSFSPGPEPTPDDDATGSAGPSTPPAPPPDSSSDDEMGRTPLQSVDTNSKKGRKRKAADGADGKRKLKKKKADSTVDDDAPSPSPKKTKGTTGGRKRATAPSAPAEVMLTEEGRVSLINGVEKVAALRHLNNVDDLAKLREQKELKNVELRVSTMTAMMLQLKLDLVSFADFMSKIIVRK